MNCPFCGAEDCKVMDSRPDDNSIRRRRQCSRCGRRFTTHEVIELMPLMVIKKDGVREEFDRSKIERGILRACHKRPVSTVQISALAAEIENELLTREEAEISTREIGELVMEKLARLDDVAYVRFASVYREFKDVDTFLQEIQRLARKK